MHLGSGFQPPSGAADQYVPVVLPACLSSQYLLLRCMEPSDVGVQFARCESLLWCCTTILSGVIWMGHSIPPAPVEQGWGTGNVILQSKSVRRHYLNATSSSSSGRCLKHVEQTMYLRKHQEKDGCPPTPPPSLWKVCTRCPTYARNSNINI